MKAFRCFVGSDDNKILTSALNVEGVCISPVGYVACLCTGFDGRVMVLKPTLDAPAPSWRPSFADMPAQGLTNMQHMKSSICSVQ